MAGMGLNMSNGLDVLVVGGDAVGEAGVHNGETGGEFIAPLVTNGLTPML